MAEGENLSREVVEAAMAGRFARLDELVERFGDRPRTDLALACALCRAEEALALIAETTDVNHALPPLGWPPLLYLCFSRVQRRRGAATAACAVAEALIEQGARVNAYKPEGSETHPETALYGAASINANAGLTRLLLAAGANPNDGTDEIGAETIYHAAELSDLSCPRLLLEAGVAQDKLSYCLGRKLDFEDPAGTALFLEHGADPNFVTPFDLFETRVHKAVRANRSLQVLDLLLASGGRIDVRDAKEHTPYALAVRLGRVGLAPRLLQAGAVEGEADAANHLLGACARGDRASAVRMVTEQPGLLEQAIANDAGHVAVMAFDGNNTAVDLMIDLGFPVDARGEFGSALHMACWRGHAATVKRLLTAGADIELRNDFGGTALDTTLYAAFNCHSPEGGMTAWGLPEDVRHGDYPGTVQVLLEAGADVSMVERFPTGRADIDSVLAEWRQ